jgi:rubrerythrin
MDADTFDRIILDAIHNEIEARDFYASAADRVDDPAVKEIFARLSREEDGHRLRLLTIKSDPMAKVEFQKVTDYGVAEEQGWPKLSLEMKPADALQLASKKEQAAMEGYQALAATMDKPELKKLFSELAEMERGHKAHLENLFVNVAYPEEW